MLRLTIEKGEPAGSVHALTVGKTTLGRSHSATFRLLSPDVSGLHAAITVADGIAQLENLSQFGTRVDGNRIEGVVTLQAGQQIEMGKITVIRVTQTDDDERPTGADEAPSPAFTPPPQSPPTADKAPTGPTVQKACVTGMLPVAEATPSVTGAGVTRAADPDISELTRSMIGTPGPSGEDEEGATRAMQTRAATPEEIEHLMELEQKKIRRRITIGLSIALPLVVLLFIFRPRTPPPEVEIEWSKNAAGDYLDRFEAAPSGGFKDGGFDVCCPDNETFKKKIIEGGMSLEGWMGRKLDVPMRVIVQEEREVRFVGMTRAQAVEDWMRQIATGGHWNFDNPSPTPAFFGRKNGVPYTRVTYLRDGGGSWFGVASVILHGDRRIVARAETPAAERVRAEKMMSAKLIRPSNDFEYAHWEGIQGAPRLDEQATLRQTRADLERMAPATWVALETLMQTLLTQAAQAGHADVVTEATQLLVKLRDRQALWFNSQKLAFDAAIMQNNWRKAQKTAEFTQAVFSNVEDQRYFDVRKWKAEP